MTLLAICILLFYFYWANRVTPLDDSLVNMTENEKILALDFDNSYPATPRETTKTFARIMKALYNNPEEEEIEPLVSKIRELYDEAFLSINPEDVYLQDIKTSIAEWRDNNRNIKNFIMAMEDQEQESEIDGVKYAVNYISYTIQENGKFTEIWKVLLRQDENERWKIVGWEYVSK